MTQQLPQSGRLFDDPAPTARDDALSRLEGVLESVTFHNEENGYTIARVKLEGNNQATVICHFINPPLGEMLEFFGTWETHKQYGKQFRAERYQLLKPATVEAMEKYLGSGLIRGIGPRTAKILVKQFGLDTLDIIEKAPHRLQEVPGIGAKKTLQIVEAWDAQREVRHIMLFLQGHGISANYAAKIYKQYGDSAIEMVTSNPYRLAQDIWGIGFKIADRIARQLGLAENTPERIEAGVLYSMQQAEDQGHCFLPEAELVQSAVLLLSTPPEDGPAALSQQEGGWTITPEEVTAGIERLVRRQLFIRDSEDRVLSPIYRRTSYIHEHTLAADLRALLTEPLHSPWLPKDVEGFVDDLCKQLEITPAKLQYQAVVESLRSRILVLTGGPGTGKTTTTRAILQAHLRCERKVLLASPTGRAAKRLSEVTGCPAQTIHRLLEVDVQSGFKFKRNAENPLECEVLIVDEVSMVDLYLAYSLLRALPKGAQLILVGDADQLPSVGAGNVLRDIIASDVVPVVRLSEVFRQAASSTIITNAHRINRGEMPDLPPTGKWREADCLFIAQEEPLEAAKKICDVVCRSLPSLGYGREEIQVLTPMQRGALGAQHLNELLQQALNPKQLGVQEFTRGQKTLRCGDRVIQMVNDYDREVFNGDIGYLRNIDLEEREFIIEYPEKEVVYSFDDADELALAYALTVHKSQGSEYPAVVLALHTQHYLLLQRNLLYTALTRAKKLALLIGSKRAIAIAVRNQNRQERFTRLDARLQGDAQESAVVEW